MSAIHLPPPCPMCRGETILKEQHRMAHSNAMMMFFRCTQCGVEYPRASDTPSSAVPPAAPDPGTA